MTQDHSCVNYVSLAGVHMGEFGATEKLEKWLPFLHNVATHEVYRVAYTSILQAHISVANFWFDPFRHKQYLTSSEFLPRFNEHNETLSTVYRKNFLKLKKVIFTASPADDIIEPYQSSLFGMWNVTDTLYDYKMLDMKDQIIYQKDVFGLKTIQQDGRMQMFLVPDVLHMGWLSRTELCDKYMLPYLD
jgi:palmitoyl-protein thioesterase